MNLYAIRRNAWESAEELEKVGARSKEVGDTESPTTSPGFAPNVRQGRGRDARLEIADTVIVRPDPEAQPAA